MLGALRTIFFQRSKLEVSDNEIERQEKSFSSKVFFLQLLKMLLLAIIAIAMTMKASSRLHSINIPTKEQAQAELDRIFNDDKTILRLVKILDPMPPRGESIMKIGSLV